MVNPLNITIEDLSPTLQKCDVDAWINYCNQQAISDVFISARLIAFSTIMIIAYIILSALHEEEVMQVKYGYRFLLLAASIVTQFIYIMMFWDSIYGD